MCLPSAFSSVVKIKSMLKETYQVCFLTLKQWADFPPAGDASLTGKLTQSSLQEKHGDTTADEEDDIWNKECTL